MRRLCAACQRGLRRHTGEEATDFAKRETCGAACALLLRTRNGGVPRARREPVSTVWRPEGWPAEVPAETLRHRGPRMLDAMVPSPFCAICDRPIRDDGNGGLVHTASGREWCYPNMPEATEKATRRPA